MPYDGSALHPGIEGDAQTLAEAAKYYRDLCTKTFAHQTIMRAYWQQIAELSYPERANFFGDFPVGIDYYEGSFTSEMSVMRRDMAKQLSAMLRNPNTDWFQLVTRPDDIMEQDEEAERWCEMATSRLRNVIYDPRANFNRAMAESDDDYVAFGNSVVKHTYNDDYSGLHFQCLHLRDCAWRENYRGVVDQMFHKMRLSLDQIAEMFGTEHMPEDWLKRMKENPTEKQTIIAVTMPVERRHKGLPRPDEGMPYYTLYMTEKEPDDRNHRGGILKEGFFKHFPYWVRRWMTVSGEDYGRSPCTGVALSDMRVLNRVERALLNGVELKTMPPLIAKDEAVADDFQLVPGQITLTDDTYDKRQHGDVVDQVDIGEPRYAMEYKQDILRRASLAFYQHLIKPHLPEKPMTATETQERVEIYIREATPLFGPMEAENAMLMEVVFERGMEQGLFGSMDDVPDSLSGAKTDFEFETPLSQALRKRKASEFDVLVGRLTTLAGLAEVFPEVASLGDNIDMDDAFRDAMAGSGPLSWVRKKEDVEQYRAEKAEAAADQQQMQQGMEMADMALNAKPEMVDKMQGMAEEMTGGEQ